MAREQTSFDLLKQLGVHRPQLRLAPDAAFAFRDDGRGEAAIQPLLERLRAAGLPLIGISAMLHLFPGAADRTAQWSRYVRALSAAARYCRDELGATVVFVPQSTGGAGEDRDAAREVALSAGVDGIEVIDRELSAYELSALYAHLELMIGTRMHANIMAMAVGTPVVAIGYEHKTAGIMEMAGMSAYAIPIRDLDPVPLVGIVQGAWFRRGETRGQLRTIVPRLVDELDLAVAEALQSVTLARQGR